mgnify:CR=1 FL=1
MNALVKYKNQVEYSFLLWIKSYPESTHPNDKERFLQFTKNVCRYNARKWKNTEFLKQRILKEKPNFNQDSLQDFIIAFDYMIEFYKTDPLPQVWRIEDTEVKKGFYIERGAKGGQFYEKQLPLE